MINLWQAQWREIVVFAIVILVLAVTPAGLFGLVRWRRSDALAPRMDRDRGRRRCLAAVMGNDYYLRIFFMMCVYYLCAAGMNVLVGYAGQKSLGQAGLFAAGAYTAALATSAFDLGPWTALLLPPSWQASAAC